MNKKKWIIVGVVVVVLIAVVAGFLYLRAKSSAAKNIETGTVTSETVTDLVETNGNLTAGRLSELQWGTSGQIEAVSVKLGQKVKKDDVLATLKADSVPAEVITAQADLLSAQQNLENVKNSKLTLAQAVEAVVTARKDVEEAETNYTALDYPRGSDVLLKDYQLQIWDAEKAMADAQSHYKQYQSLPPNNPNRSAALQKYVTAKENYDTLVATYNWLISKPTAADYEEAKATLDTARAKYEDAKRQRDLVKSGQNEADIAAAEAKVNAFQAIVDSKSIIAPFDGEVIAVQALTGNIVTKGTNAIVIVDKSTLQIDTLVDEGSIGLVKIGNPVQITFESQKSDALTGKVLMINPIGKEVSGLIKYTVTISVDPTDALILYGATATVVIQTSEPYAALTVPLNAVMSDNDSEYVMVVSGEGTQQKTTRVNVTSSTLVDSKVVIVPSGDLKAGDRVVVNSSSSSKSSGFGGGGGPMMGPGGG